MKKWTLNTMALLMLSSPAAHAGLLIEPYVGYETGKATTAITVDGTLLPSSDDDFSGTAFGLRLGYSLALFTLGAEYSMGSGDIDGTDYTNTDVGVFFAFDFPVLVRAYATYFFDAKSDIDNSNGIEGELPGKGYKVGVGYTGLPLISLNLEVIAKDYDNETLMTTPSVVEVDNKTASYMLSVSFPFEI